MPAKLYKPQNSILPGGYDFGFYAYLSEIGANGYAMSPPKILLHREKYINRVIYKIRFNIYQNLVKKLGSIKGNFAAAILLGEKRYQPAINAKYEAKRYFPCALRFGSTFIASGDDFIYIDKIFIKSL